MTHFPPPVRALLLLAAGLFACAPQPPQPSPGHLSAQPQPPPQAAAIPPPVQRVPYVPPPAPAKETELYTVVVDQVPVRELLFALARDASLNVDIHPLAQGVVTLNAIDQTLPQILERIAAQTHLRYEFSDGYLSIGPDTPYVRHYPVGYVNMDRESTSEVTVATQVAATGSGAVASGSTSGNTGTAGASNNSTTKISSVSKNAFWEHLRQSVIAIISGEGEARPGQAATPAGENVVAHPESGLLTVRASHRQHQEIQKFLDQVLKNVQRQVLIEATIVEVRLGDHYQAGVDWQRIAGDYSYTQSVTGANLNNPPAYVFRYTNPVSRLGDISATLRLLEQYGNVKVLSSPKIMALNNQSAILKVVDNRVYFTVGVQVSEPGDRGTVRTTYETVVQTVPEGLIINVTPQISENGMVTLNIRPTISRIIGYVNDPNPALAAADVISRIPEVQVREIESLLKVNSGDVAIIGGLMQDVSEQATSGVPVLSKLPAVGDLFSYRDDQYRKTELVIFLRPLVIQDASLEGDLKDYRVYLPDPGQPDRAPPTGLDVQPENLY